MDPVEFLQALTHNRRLKMKWVWEWLGRLPMHFEFEESASSSTSSDGDESYVGDTDGHGAGAKVIEGGVGDRQGVAEAEAGSERVLPQSTEMVRRRKKRVYVEAEGDVQVIDLTGDDGARVLEGNGGGLAKKARRVGTEQSGE